MTTDTPELVESAAEATTELTGAATGITLNFINNSNDTNNSEVLIFAKDAGGLSELAIAWTVIRNCGRGSHHPFLYPMDQQVAASDAWGNFTPQLNAEPGQCFHMILTESGDMLQLKGPASNPRSIEVANDLMQGSINALIFKADRLFAIAQNIVPGQRAAFQFKPTLWIGVASQIEEGDVINSAILSSVNTEISLLGLRSADIVMTGGGSGPNATPFTFALENLVYA